MSKGLVFWFTGLSGSGKSTVADAVKERLEGLGAQTLILDGDDVRSRLHRHLGFSVEDIKENNALIVGMCKELRPEYDVLLVPIISPFLVSRSDARAALEPGFFEIFFMADLECVAGRDVKGLYDKARRGELENLIGFSANVPYEPPPAPDLAIDSNDESEEESKEKLYRFALDKLGGPQRVE